MSLLIFKYIFFLALVLFFLYRLYWAAMTCLGYKVLYSMYCKENNIAPKKGSNYSGFVYVFLCFWVWNVYDFCYDIEEADNILDWYKKYEDTVLRKR